MTAPSVWAEGDYQQVAARLVRVSEDLCDAVAARPGEAVIDVATGTGNTALAAARRFCVVTGVDKTPELLERAGRRSVAEGLAVELVAGAAERLPFRSGCFDVVLSTFGVMFAADADSVAAELVRVCRPGGRIGLANWTLTGFTAALRALVAAFDAVPEWALAADHWGDRDRARALLEPRGVTMFCRTRTHVIRHRSSEAYCEFLLSTSGSYQRLLPKLSAASRESFRGRLLHAVQEANQSGDQTLEVPVEYLEVTATRERDWMG